jgi:hypothetical protein
VEVPFSFQTYINYHHKTPLKILPMIGDVTNLKQNEKVLYDRFMRSAEAILDMENVDNIDNYSIIVFLDNIQPNHFFGSNELSNNYQLISEAKRQYPIYKKLADN